MLKAKMIPLIPYFTTSRYRVQAMIELANCKPHDIGADLGSGDGRIVIEFAKAGIQMHGYEIDKKLVDESLKAIKEQKIHNAMIFNKNFWEIDLSPYSIITVYGMPDIMEELENKLLKELKPGARILSNYYQFPNLKLADKRDNIYLYKI